MELLITPARVAEMAFRAPDRIAADAIPCATILAAQQKFIKPVVGRALYDALCGGAYPSLTEDYLAMPLALYVKMLMLPSLAVQVGAAGVVEVNSKNLARVGDEKLRAAIIRLKDDAGALMRRATDHIEASGEVSGTLEASGAPGEISGASDPISGGTAYPEYDPHENILNRCSVAGGVVLES